MEGQAVGPRLCAKFLKAPEGPLCVAYGYRLCEVLTECLKPPKDQTCISRVSSSPIDKRPMMCSLGPVVPSAVQPHPDLYDAATTLGGILKRAASKHPDPDIGALKRLGVFVLDWLKINLTPLSAGSDTSVERWLAHCSYPHWRKMELLDKHYAVINRRDRRYRRAKCFIKDETYPEYKHARGIYSRTDEFKTFVGPIVKLIEEEVYKLPQFIKHVPHHKRPKYILEYLNPDGTADATDYTAFESIFTAHIQKAVEQQLYKYMTEFLPDGDEFMWHMSALFERQKCEFKYVSAELPACRLSGDMCTSLGNGFSNLMFALFVLHEKGCTNIRIVIEGDDGLMCYSGPRVTAEDFARLGLTIKLDRHERIETASFCGIIFDEEEQINIDDPRDALATFGWGTNQYTLSKRSKKMSLLRCKALSLAHQYPGCPIISELAQYGLRVTRGHDIRHLGANARNTWYRDQLLAAIKDEKNIPIKTPGQRSRFLVEEKYGITVERQLKIEEYLRSKNDLGPLISPHINSIMPDSWVQYAVEYVRFVDKKNLKEHINTSGATDHIVGLLSLDGVILKGQAKLFEARVEDNRALNSNRTN